MALSPHCLKNRGALVRTHSDATDNNLRALSPLKTSSIEKNSPQNNETSAGKLCTAGTPGRLLKRQCGESWWVMQSNQSGECSLLCVFWFVCLAFPPFFLFCLSLNGERRRLIWVSSSLGNITLRAIWYAYHLAVWKCSSARCQHWHGNLSVRVQIAEASSPLPFIRLLNQKLFSREGVSMANEERQFCIEVLKKKKKKKSEP